MRKLKYLKLDFSRNLSEKEVQQLFIIQENEKIENTFVHANDDDDDDKDDWFDENYTEVQFDQENPENQ